jgi:hypothetical protein
VLENPIPGMGVKSAGRKRVRKYQARYRMVLQTGQAIADSALRPETAVALV